ncbi:MAG: hypothetical protein IKA02_00320 [Clostridia bacterium]|nr:hypothetical protein [Clostridia bacterium]
MLNDKYNSGGSLPIGFSMALAHNLTAFNAFLSMNDDKQDEIIEKARNTKTGREMQLLVDSLPSYKFNENNTVF